MIICLVSRSPHKTSNPDVGRALAAHVASSATCKSAGCFQSPKTVQKQPTHSKQAVAPHKPSILMLCVRGGIVIFWAEGRQRPARVQSVDEMSGLDALKVGLAQCVAMIPGVSRSGATIIGGMLMGLSRPAATEFSFFLAIPTLIGAGVYSLWSDRALLAWADAPLFAVGLALSFGSALACVRWLLRYIASHSFVLFAWYRIIFGLLILLTWQMDWVQWSH